MDNKLEQWLTFIDATNREAVKMAIANNKVLQKAEAEYNYLTGDEAQRRLEELRNKMGNRQKKCNKLCRRKRRKKG